MSKQQKLLEKAKNHPNSLSFAEFQTLMKRFEWVMDHQTGSHQIWYSLSGNRLSIQNANGKAKGYQVKQFLQIHKEENGDA